MHWQGWTEMGHIFSPENVGQLLSYYYISRKLEHIYTEKQQDNTEDKGSKQMEGMVQEEGMLDKIGIVHWMSLPNTPILWTTSVINCTILLQEICFRATQCYKCRLLVRGSKGQFITNFTDGFYQIIWNPVKSLEVMLTVEQAWQMELAPIFQYKPCVTNHLLVNLYAFAMGQNLHWYIN